MPTGGEQFGQWYGELCEREFNELFLIWGAIQSVGLLLGWHNGGHIEEQGIHLFP